MSIVLRVLWFKGKNEVSVEGIRYILGFIGQRCVDTSVPASHRFIIISSRSVQQKYFQKLSHSFSCIHRVMILSDSFCLSPSGSFCSYPSMASSRISILFDGKRFVLSFDFCLIVFVRMTLSDQIHKSQIHPWSVSAIYM